VFIGTTDFENAGTVTVRVEVVYTRTGSGGGTPSTTSMSPTSGSGANQNFAFTVADSAGWQRLAVVDVLINNFLDGRHACFLAFVPTGADSGTIYLIDDAGDAGGPYATLQIPSAGSVQNSQCKISGSSVVATSGNSLTLALSVTFTSAFSGNKVVYVAAGDVSMLNTGWEVMGTWNVPGAIPSGPSVTGVTPAHSTSSNQIYTFAVGDTKGWQDIAVVDVLINSALNGIGACYVAFVPANAFGGSLYLVDNAGNAGGPYAGMLLPSGSSVSNGQCTIHGSGSSLSGAFGNTLMLTLSITFSSSFSGNKIVNVATVSKGGTNSGWQSVGTAAVP
jgi:hypothetical protein